jgi:hypothetical protein
MNGALEILLGPYLLGLRIWELEGIGFAEK